MKLAAALVSSSRPILTLCIPPTKVAAFQNGLGHNNNNRTLLDAPVVGAATTLVPSPVVATTVPDPTKPTDDATAATVAPTSTSPAAAATSTTPAVAATTTVAGSVAGSAKPGATPGSATGSVKPAANGGPALANGSVQRQANGSVQRQANGSVRGSVQRSTGGPMPTIAASPMGKVASVQGSAQKQGSQQQQGSQQGPMLAPVMAPMLPEPMLPSTQPVDTKQEIVENYLNSLPQNLPTSTANRMGHFMNNRFLLKVLPFDFFMKLPFSGCTTSAPVWLMVSHR